MSPGLGLEQSQQLELTPEMRMGIEIMAMPVMELRALIANIAMSNPFLKLDDGYLSHNADASTSVKMRDESQSDSIEEDSWEHGVEAGVWDSTWSSTSSNSDSRYQADPEDTFSRTADDRSCLESVMLEQLKLDLRDPMDIKIAEYLMNGIDDAGYLRMDTDIAADVLGTSPDRVEFVLCKLQRECTPAGIGARSLQERLLAQLISAGEDDSTTRKIVENHLERLASGNLQAIANTLGISTGEVKHSLEKIRHLDPHPTSEFDRATPTMMPEVMVIGSQGDWHIKVRKGLLPQVMIDHSYTDLLDSQALGAESIRKMKELVREAKGFIRAIDLRKTSVIAIACAIIEKQASFFDVGIPGLRPLTMAEVADATGLSESTVSRVANSITMDTPRGIISMRYFFHSGIGANPTGDGASSMAVKAAIQELVDAEDKHHPLSDTKLMELLNERGMPVSRRTVNKYRTALGILSGSKRKVY